MMSNSKIYKLQSCLRNSKTVKYVKIWKCQILVIEKKFFKAIAKNSNTILLVFDPKYKKLKSRKTVVTVGSTVDLKKQLDCTTVELTDSRHNTSYNFVFI